MATTTVDTKLNTYIERMPGGQFLDLHTGDLSTADGIVILANGTVCAVAKGTTCSLNPMHLGKDHVTLSPFSTGGAFDGRRKESLGTLVEMYNEALMLTMERLRMKSFSDYIIRDFHSFREDW